MNEIPNRPWLRLEEAEAALFRSGAVNQTFVEWDGKRCISGDARIQLSKLLSDAAFEGAIALKGRPARPHDGVGFAPHQDIPLTYFRKTRSFYGCSGIGRLSFEPTADELRQDSIDINGDGGETDWVDVLVSRDGINTLCGEAKADSRSGAPGRPTSMHLVEIEFRRRMDLGLSSSTNTEEAETLSKWLLDSHPTKPRLTAKTIRNHLGPLRRELEAARN